MRAQSVKRAKRQRFIAAAQFGQTFRHRAGIQKLLEKRLICEIGRADTPGKPILFGTSKEFLRYFGFKSIRELPPLEEENSEEAKEKDAETEFHT